MGHREGIHRQIRALAEEQGYAVVSIDYRLAPETKLPDLISDIEAACGFDPLRDLSELTVWIRGADGEAFESFGASLTGRTIDAAAIAECHGALVDARYHD